MEDYIDILSKELEEHWADFLGGDYYMEKVRQNDAERALRETLSESQTALFLAYEEHRNASGVYREACMIRQAFLLAKEIFR